jgi:hypothetical protein
MSNDLEPINKVLEAIEDLRIELKSDLKAFKDTQYKTNLDLFDLLEQIAKQTQSDKADKWQ